MSVGISLVGLVLACIAFAFWLGTLRSSVSSAHHKIDQLEQTLERALKAIDESVKEGWRQCPLAMQAHDKHKITSQME